MSGPESPTSLPGPVVATVEAVEVEAVPVAAAVPVASAAPASTLPAVHAKVASLFPASAGWIPPGRRVWFEEAARLASGPLIGGDGLEVWSGCGLDRFALSVDSYAGIGVSDDATGLLLIRSDGPEIMYYRVVDCADVLACDVVGGGSAMQAVTTSQTATMSRNSMSVKGAVVGGLLLGPAGGLAGGLGYGRSTSEGQTTGSIQAVSKNIEGSGIRLTLNDPQSPHFSIDLPDSSSAAQLSSKLSVVMKRGAKRLREMESGDGDPLTVPDAIMKLVSLVERGYITNDEFEQQKAKLLAGSAGNGSCGSKTSEWARSSWANPLMRKNASGTINVIGLTVREAAKKLETQGYRNFYYKSGIPRSATTSQHWIVVEQDPVPGSDVNLSVVVTLVGMPPEALR